MTINVDGKVAALEGVALEVIEAFAGIEQSRRRLVHGDDARLVVHGSVTLILREVQTADDLQPKPGEQRHGDLAGPGEVSQGGLNSNLVDGDLDAKGAELQQTALDAQERALTVLHQFLATEGQPVQEEIYSELRQVHRAYADAVAEFEAHQLAVAA